MTNHNVNYTDCRNWPKNVPSTILFCTRKAINIRFKNLDVKRFELNRNYKFLKCPVQNRNLLCLWSVHVCVCARVYILYIFCKFYSVNIFAFKVCFGEHTPEAKNNENGHTHRTCSKLVLKKTKRNLQTINSWKRQ